MLLYCLGNAGAKRRTFRRHESGKVSIDNDEVVADFLLDGKVCFVVGDIPFADFTVLEYMNYAKSLNTRLRFNDKAMKTLLKQVGCNVSLRHKMGALNRVDYKKVVLAARLAEDTQSIYINFDSLPFSRMNRYKIFKMLLPLSKKYAVYASVSDGRLVQKGCNSVVYSSLGTIKGFIESRGKSITQRKLHRKLKKQGMVFKWKKIRDVFVCDN